MEGFSCQIKVQPLAEWVKKEDGKTCPVCVLAPLVQFYMGSLEDVKANDHLANLKKAWEGGDPLTITETMDRIKSEVGDTLKQELVSYDCMAQSYEE